MKCSRVAEDMAAADTEAVGTSEAVLDITEAADGVAMATAAMAAVGSG
jgi:hypothetical protein